MNQRGKKKESAMGADIIEFEKWMSMFRDRYLDWGQSSLGRIVRSSVSCKKTKTERGDCN